MTKSKCTIQNWMTHILRMPASGTAMLLVLAPLAFITESLKAVAPLSEVTPEKSSLPANQFVTDLVQFKAATPISVITKKHTITLPDREFLTRLKASDDENLSSEKAIEPIQVTTELDDKKILALSERLAKKGRTLALANYLRENFESGEAIPGTKLRSVTINSKALELINRESLDELFAKDHFELTVLTNELKQDPVMSKKFIADVKPFLDSYSLKVVQRKIKSGEPINVEQLLLPKQVRKAIRRHTVYRGPNCFHAALSFQSPKLSQTARVNVREEPGYHRNMLNYDELWRVTQSEFYEIDPTKTDLAYGDMILFFDVKSGPKDTVDFRTLRHAATYLVGGHVYAKGSKSANSPYIIRPLADEWSTWQKYTKNLGAKVFRRNTKSVSKAILWTDDEWMQ